MRRAETLNIAGIVAGGAVLALVAPHVVGTYTLTVLIAYALLALSLGVVWGYGGILCFGQAAFFGLGGYTYAISAINIGESTLPFLLGMLVPMGFAFLLGAMMFYGRLSDVYLGVITLVVSLIFFKYLNSTAGPEYMIGSAPLGGFNGIFGFPILNVPFDPDAYIAGDDLYWVAAAALVIVFLLMRWLMASPFGRIAVAIRENETRAELMGYDVRIRKTVLFSVGAGVAGLAGTLFACWAEIVTPGMFSLTQSAEIIIWCIVGGRGRLISPIVGAVALSYLKVLLGQQRLVDNMLILGLILTLSVLFLPRGLVPALGSAAARIAGLVRRGRPERRTP